MKRKCEIDLFPEDDFIPRPAKRLSMCDNTPKQARDQKKRLLRTCRRKLKKLVNPEANLHRTLLLNNVYKQLQTELKSDKPAKSYGYAVNPRCPFGYGAGAKEVAHRRKLAKLQEVLNRKGSEASGIVGNSVRDSTTDNMDIVNRSVSDMDYSVCHTSSHCDTQNTRCEAADSDMEEIDVCTVDDEAPVLAITPDTTRAQTEVDTRAQVDAAACRDSSSHSGVSFSDQWGTSLSEQACVAEQKWSATTPSVSEWSATTPSVSQSVSEWSATTPCDNHPDTHMQPHSTLSDSHYLPNLQSFCLSPFYTGIQGYLSPTYFHGLTGLYTSLPSYSGQTSTQRMQPSHPTASVVRCT